MLSLSNHRLLVIAPHPDDEVLGCGGTMAKMKDLGGEVYVLIVTVGDATQYGGQSEIETRVDEARSVMDSLKIDSYDIALPGEQYHLKLDTIPRKDLIDLIESKSKVSIAKVKPTIVALPFGYSYNQDHEAVFKAGFAACRPTPDNLKYTPKVVLSYEQPSTFWSSEIFVPNFYVDTSKYLDMKVKALMLYKSQMRNPPHPRSIESIRRISQMRGGEICVKAAEAFICHKIAL